MARRLKAREALEDFLGKQAKGMSERTIADKGADSEEAKWSEDDWKNSIYDVLKEHGTEFDKDDWAEAFEDYEDEDTGTTDDTDTTETETKTVDEDTDTGDTTETETEVVDDTTDTSNDDTSDSKGYDIDKYNVYIDGSEDGEPEDGEPVDEGSEDDELIEYSTDKSNSEDDESDDSTQRNIADTLANLRL